MKLNKKMKRILAFVLSLAMVVSTFGLNVVSADDEWVSTNNGWINFTEDGYVTGDVNRYAVEGISAIYAGVWDDGKTANIDVLRNAETPNSLAIDVKDNTHDDQWLVQVACNVKGLDSTKVYKVELKLDGTTVLDTANVSSAEKYEKIVGIGNNEALTVGKHTLTLETEELVKGDTPVEVKNIEITPNEAQIAATRKIFANWTNPEGTAKAYAYLEEAKEENGVCTDGKGWAFNVSAAQPMTSVDNVSRTYSDTDTITVEAGKTYKFIVESFNAFGDKTGEGSVDITIPAKTQEEIDAENKTAELKANLESDKNLAKGKEAFVLSKEADKAAITDGNNGSRWQADKAVDNTTFGVNLGSVQKISSVVVSWEPSNATAYDIFVAGADEVYGDTPVASVSGLEANKNLVVETKFDEVEAQYVKVVATGWSPNAEAYGISVYELGVFGEATVDETTTPVVEPGTVETTTPAKQDETTTPAKQDETTTPVKQDETTTPAPVVPTVPVAAEKDWSAEDFISSSDATYNDTYKAIKDGAINEIVNIQPADDTLGLYVSFADADFGTITVNGKTADIKVAGAGIWFKLSNFTDMYNDVVITNGAGTVKATLYVYNKNGVDNSKKDDETTTSAKQDETTTPAKQDETTTPAKQDETTTPAKQDETTTPAKQDETTTPAKQDETTTAKQDVTTTTAKQNETTTSAKQNETTTVAPTTKAISTTAAPATVKKTTVKKTTVKATAKKLSSNKVKLSVKKVAGASKYAVQISTTKNFKKVVAKKTSKKAVFTVKSKKLKGKKKLYVRVKVYKKVNGKTVASQWSKATKIRLKK